MVKVVMKYYIKIDKRWVFSEVNSTEKTPARAMAIIEQSAINYMRSCNGIETIKVDGQRVISTSISPFGLKKTVRVLTGFDFSDLQKIKKIS